MSTAGFAQASEYLVVYGAGGAGLWTTEFTLANMTAEESSVGIGDRPIQICPPINQCYVFATLPPNGTTVVEYPVDGFGTGIGAAYIFAGHEVPPSVLARAHASGVSCASADLPVFRLAALIALNPASLVLPGARRGTSGRSNLLLANVADPLGPIGESVNLAIEAFSSDGTLLGQTSATLAYGATSFVADVLGALGVSEVDDGQLRITKLGGGGVMWAMMPIIRSDGSLSVSVGVAP
jgi:hypothetical protein